jgi:hypothetical protein
MDIGRIKGAKVVVRGIAVAAYFTVCDGIVEPCLNSKSLLSLPPIRFSVPRGVAPFPRLVLGVA